MTSVRSPTSRIVSQTMIGRRRKCRSTPKWQKQLDLRLKSWQFFLKNGPTPPLFCLFSSFQANITILTTNKCEKCSSSIRCWDSNPQPLKHESPPMTRAPALDTSFCYSQFYSNFDKRSDLHKLRGLVYLYIYCSFKTHCLLLKIYASSSEEKLCYKQL